MNRLEKEAKNIQIRQLEANKIQENTYSFHALISTRHDFTKPIKVGIDSPYCWCTPQNLKLNCKNWYECDICHVIHNFDCEESDISDWELYSIRRIVAGNVLCNICSARKQASKHHRSSRNSINFTD